LYGSAVMQAGRLPKGQRVAGLCRRSLLTCLVGFLARSHRTPVFVKVALALDLDRGLLSSVFSLSYGFYSVNDSIYKQILISGMNIAEFPKRRNGGLQCCRGAGRSDDLSIRIV